MTSMSYRRFRRAALRPLLCSLATVCVALFGPVFAALAVRPQDPAGAAPATQNDWVELHRLRIVNAKDGAVQVSTDGGNTWRLLGRVNAPATTVAEGYLAANYAEPGTVAATAVHGLRIRTGGQDPTLHAPLTLAVQPREFAGPVNKGYGGHVAGSAGIFTDIPAGSPFFRGLAPFVGNPVFSETRTGRLVPLPDTFQPKGQPGETLVILVRRPKNPLVEVTFENRAGGEVTATFADGTKQTVTSVVQPVKGVGRFDGTAYTGVGRINTAHTGVITVGTAPVDASLPEGEGRERRGGFQITPAWHNARTEEAGAPMVLIVGQPGRTRTRDLEGRPPLFRDMVGLSAPDANGTIPGALADVQIDNNPAWEPMPTLIGLRLDAFTGPGLTRVWRAQGSKRTATRGVTAFRLRLPVLQSDTSALLAARASDSYRLTRLQAAKAGRVPLVEGSITINAAPTDRKNVAFVRWGVDGVPKGVTNSSPFSFTWDTTSVPDGEYLVEAEAIDDAGAVLTSTRRRVFVLNSPAAQAVVPKSRASAATAGGSGG